MTGSRSHRLLTPIAIISMAAILALLAFLQYRWIGEASAADRERLQRSLTLASGLFRDDFNHELVQLATWFQTPELIGGEDWSLLAQHVEDWRSFGPGELRISDVHVLENPGQAESRALLIQPGGEASRSDWPDRLKSVSGRLVGRGGGPGGPGGPGGRRGGPPVGRVWTYVSTPPALAQVITAYPQRQERERRGGRPQVLALLIIELDPEYLRQVTLSSMEALHFGAVEDHGYRIAIFHAETGEIVYATDGMAVELPRDQATPLLWTREEIAAQEIRRTAAVRGRGRGAPSGRGDAGGRGGWGLRGSMAPAAMFRGPVIVTPGDRGDGWMLAATLAGGSVDTVVADLRSRNLAVGFGVLGVLGLAMTGVMYSARRAQRLAELEMDFVANVSHELRTPLTVILSAGDNLAEGVVAGPEQVQEYGQLIKQQGARLTTMIEQTLQFAAVRAGRRKYTPEVVDPQQLLKRMLDECRPSISEAGFELEAQIDDGLPSIQADPGAIGQSIQNLIHNAIKYGGEARWLGVRATNSGGEVLISVADRGMGIDSDEARHIFEPFYRGSRATDAQIQGSGLGLSLAKEAAEASGGRLTVESSPEQGSVFTLHLPIEATT